VELWKEGKRAGGGGPIQEDLGRSGSRGVGVGICVGQRRVDEASRRVSIVCCWCLIVPLEMRLATELGSSSVGVCGREAREKGRGVGALACSKTALMLRKRGLALRVRWSREFIGGKVEGRVCCVIVDWRVPLFKEVYRSEWECGSWRWVFPQAVAWL
jgi:hypothetical protein